MSGAHQGVFMNQRSFEPNIGDAFGGGFFAGQISTTGDSVATHNLVVGPVSTAQNNSVRWKTNASNDPASTPGADSVIDGPTNTANIVADGPSFIFQAAHFCNNLSIGGFSDWYMPAENELDVCYFNLKPTTMLNSTQTLGNANAVPARASSYTTGNPAQTSAAAFQSGGAEAFTALSYWSSTQFSSVGVYARAQYFGNGRFFPNRNKELQYRVRAIRRVAV